MIQIRAPRASLILVFFCLIIFQTYAQKTTIYTDKDATFKLGVELFEKEKFGSAQKLFQKYLENSKAQTEETIDAEYYSAICALELFNEDAEFLLRNFVTRHPESKHIKMAYFNMGNFQYRKKRYKEAIVYFEKVNPLDLTNAQLTDYYFKLGYSYFSRQNYEKAQKLFFEIKDVDNKYTAPALYYYSHIAYLNKNYETAQKGFLKLSDNPNFGPLVPYYIAQIYYLQGKYDEVINYAPALLDSANIKRQPEIAHLLGDAYFKKGKYSDALPYFEKYQKSASQLSRGDYYQIAYSYYKANDFTKAILYFKKSIKDADSLTQLAHYHMADCYIHSNNKQLARISMQTASKMNFDKEIQEDALFNFAKLAFELSYNPYQEAISAFETYIRQYPNSPRLDEAYNYLVNVYLTTKNYKDALTSIEKIQQKSQNMQFAYQKIAYYRGVELFNDKSLENAITNFNKALIYPKDKSINALSYYWKGEAYYRMGNYTDAIKAYKSFLFEPGAALLSVFKTANYNLGYAFFKSADYPNAIIWFRKYVGTPDQENQDTKKLNDAYTRIGDAYFVSKDYSNAVEYYSQAAKINALNNDYVVFQQASAMGVLGRFDSKIETLQKLINTYPKSPYLDDAKYELANTYLIQNQNEKALSVLTKLVDEFPNSSYVKKCLLKMALIYYNSDQNKLALELNKRIIADYPQSAEAREALTNMRTIYIETSNLAEFEDYLKTKSITISASTLDSATYEAAELRYVKGDCENASKDFDAYLTRYPNAYFKLNANFYKAECDYKYGFLADALKGYVYVTEQSKSNFTEKALIKSAYIYFKRGAYTEALAAYTKLEEIAEVPSNIMDARIGQMRSNFQLKQYSMAIATSKKIIAMEKIPNEILYECHSLNAKSYLASGNDSLAMDEFVITSKLTKNELGAEAKYNIAVLQFKKAEYQASEKTIDDIIKQVPSYDYWIAKSFILWADIYMALKDNFQAKATLQSIIDNAEIAELVEEAKQKLAAINKAEADAVTTSKPELIEIPFEESKLENMQLFNDTLNKK
ncbi:MAG: tetratricopeptide repeat protein [Bacteroidetes bacterium]|nr:tetratricopeptide repeat protein [Bacteroidota bacterium]MBK9671501.1 tetratricopeptide repeat protein [Bacteroidota bacterium]